MSGSKRGTVPEGGRRNSFAGYRRRLEDEA
jgi:hypothetical protein